MEDVYIEQTKLHLVFRRINMETFYKDVNETSRLIDDAIAHYDCRKIKRQHYRARKISLLVQGDAYEQHKILTHGNNIVSTLGSVAVTFFGTTYGSSTEHLLTDAILIHTAPEQVKQLSSGGKKSTLDPRVHVTQDMTSHVEAGINGGKTKAVNPDDIVCLEENIPLVTRDDKDRKRNKKGLLKKCKAVFRSVFTHDIK